MVYLFNNLVVIFEGSVGIVTALLLSVGIILLMGEVLIPGFGAMGLSGLIVSVIGLVYRIVCGLDFTQSLILIVLYLIVLGVTYSIFVFSLSRGLLSHLQLFSDKPSIPYDFEKSNTGKFLLGKVGVTSTSCKPVGKARIDGKEYEVITETTYLEKDVNVKVIKVTDDEVVVSKI